MIQRWIFDYFNTFKLYHSQGELAEILSVVEEKGFDFFQGWEVALHCKLSDHHDGDNLAFAEFILNIFSSTMNEDSWEKLLYGGGYGALPKDNRAIKLLLDFGCEISKTFRWQHSGFITINQDKKESIRRELSFYLDDLVEVVCGYVLWKS